jgi:hypothetical protein
MAPQCHRAVTARSELKEAAQRTNAGEGGREGREGREGGGNMAEIPGSHLLTPCATKQQKLETKATYLIAIP